MFVHGHHVYIHTRNVEHSQIQARSLHDVATVLFLHSIPLNEKGDKSHHNVMGLIPIYF